ncbi:hypothetical protein [Mariprofundus ferrooxydans]|uniref:Uncharacterized protein n=1 Tax=Mariprofundus ferrooxydans PV-1 TaxID=314345 RepID=Q0F3E5_9PROT|nr:hypothetical protein [Mariprofundus ferrooxydans]EAU55996.1 hypothetical protein SPV1_04228 [Mariprofundus ferrooxydans PV-1]KON48265.1 hypothetical protein AL013_04320 [Mariprofundus ferrooxydans]
MPKLKPGEIAPGVAAISQKKQASVRNLLKVLQKALSTPKDTPQTTLDAMSGYRALCKWKDTDLGITPMSEATLRKYIKKFYKGGLPSFEKDRQKILIRSVSAIAKPGTRDAYKQTCKNVHDEDQVITNHILQFSNQYLDLLEKTSEISRSHKFLQDTLKAHTLAYPSAFRGLRVITDE